MTSSKLGLFSCLLLLASASTALADAPGIIPLQGFLADRDGEPVEGAHRLTFILYDAESDGAALYTDDRRSVEIERGQFWVYLGSDDGAPLDLALFREHGAVWLEVTVDGRDVIQPRISLGSVPYAGFAQYCGEATTLGGMSAADVSSSYVDADGDTMSGALSVEADLSAAGNLTVGGKIVSGKFGQDRVTLAGPLPLDFTFSTAGGTLLVMVSGSGYTGVGGPIGATVSLDGAGLGTLSTYANEINSHKAFPAESFVVQRPAGSHTVSFAAIGSTITDGNDPFSVTVLELPF